MGKAKGVTKTFCDWCSQQVGQFSNEGGRMKSALNVSGDWCEGCIVAVTNFLWERKPKKKCDLCGHHRPVSQCVVTREVSHGRIQAVSTGPAMLCWECYTKESENNPA